MTLLCVAMRLFSTCYHSVFCSLNVFGCLSIRMYMMLRLPWGDSGWGRYQPNTNWWNEHGNPRQCGTHKCVEAHKWRRHYHNVSRNFAFVKPNKPVLFYHWVNMVEIYIQTGLLGQQNMLARKLVYGTSFLGTNFCYPKLTRPACVSSKLCEFILKKIKQIEGNHKSTKVQYFA